jgi:hypothetical protein
VGKLPWRRAGRHPDEDIVHALRNAVFDYPDQGDHELTMAVGPARNGVTIWKSATS